ncbi:SSI family serine proteinase inhibitor [Streptomyces sp. NPDC057877]|uniref:SSI family serine proteinase inhibitor n=1 Tax=Streptomyces sp. NPDC057877 TaxID=3346269 RepID=UPI0036A3723E
MTYTTTANAVRGPLLAAAVLLTLSAVPAHATAPRGGLAGDWLYLTVTKGSAQSGDTRGTLLLCDPPQGHARAAEACDQLAVAAGDIGRIPLRDGYCATVYAPVTAQARGQWRGQPVTYRQTFSNPCELGARTGAVFALDES